MIGEKEQHWSADAAARLMPMKRGEYDYVYNALAAVDGASGVIVAAALANIAPDVGHLSAPVAQARVLRDTAQRPDGEPTTLSADSGYFSHDNVAEDGGGIDLLMTGRADLPAPGSGAGVFPADCIGYDGGRDIRTCPADNALTRPVIPPGATGRPTNCSPRVSTSLRPSHATLVTQSPRGCSQGDVGPSTGAGGEP